MKKVFVLCMALLLMFALSVPVMAAPSTLENGLVLYYGFDNDTGTTVKDQSPTANNATSTSITYVDGKVGKAAVFNGTDSIINFTNAAAFTDISIAIWLKVENLETDGNQVLAGVPWQNGSIHSGYGYDKTNKWGSISFGICEWKNTEVIGDREDAAKYIMTDKAAFDGKWIQATFTYDNATKTRHLYINGVLMYTSTAVTAPKDLFKGDYEIGAYTPDTGAKGRHIKGAMDEFRVYNRVLTQDEAKELSAMGGGVEVPVTEPTATPAPTDKPTAKPATAKPTATPAVNDKTSAPAASATPVPVNEPSNGWIVWAIVGAVVVIGGGALLIFKKKK